MIETLLSSLTKRGVQITYVTDQNIIFWPSTKATSQEIETLKAQKLKIIYYLKGYPIYLKGSKISSPVGNGLIYETYPQDHKVAITGLDTFPLTFGFDECAAMGSYLFLKDRFNYIEKTIYSAPPEAWPEFFKAFGYEWKWLFKELNRQQFLIESICGPIITNGPFKTHEGGSYASV